MKLEDMRMHPVLAEYGLRCYQIQTQAKGGIQTDKQGFNISMRK
jgi:hypothetical protein